MSTGVDRAEAQSPGQDNWTETQQPETEAIESFAFGDLIDEEAEESRGVGVTILGALLILAALGWAGFGGYVVWTNWPGADLAAWATSAATLSAPLISPVP